MIAPNITNFLEKNGLLFACMRHNSPGSESESDEMKNSTLRKVTINVLPSEIMLLILDLISVQDRARCAQVCKTWKNYVCNQRFWRSIFPVQWSHGTSFPFVRPNDVF